MKQFLKFTSLLLALLMLLTAIVGCAGKSEPEETEKLTEVTAASEAQEVTVTQFVADALPDTLDFGGAECHIFCWDSWDPGEFFVEEDTGEIVDSAVYYRNLAVEERLGVKLVWDLQDRNSAAYGSAVLDAVSNQNASGDGYYDLMASYSCRIASAAAKSMFMNLHDCEYIDLDMPWYYDSAIQAGTLKKGYTFFFAGDISFNALARMSGVFFNKGFITDFQLEDPYDLVLNGTWTIDKMHEMIAGIYSDLDNNGKPSDSDRFGVMIANDQTNTLYYGTGSHFIDHAEDGTLQISADVYSERTLTILEKYLSLFGEDGAYKNPITDDPSIFDEGRSLFYIYPLGHVSSSTLRGSTTDYGFIPQPKVDETESTYYASVTNAVTLFAIPLVVESGEKASALAECLSSEGYRQVTPIVFEQAYKVKYNQDEGERQALIFDMMRDNIVFDLGKLFADSFSGFSNGVIGSFIWGGNDKYTSSVARMEKVFTKALASLTESLED